LEAFILGAQQTAAAYARNYGGTVKEIRKAQRVNQAFQRCWTTQPPPRRYSIRPCGPSRTRPLTECAPIKAASPDKRQLGRALGRVKQQRPTAG
jgi:hypothetical protein